MLRPLRETPAKDGISEHRAQPADRGFLQSTRDPLSRVRFVLVLAPMVATPHQFESHSHHLPHDSDFVPLSPAPFYQLQIHELRHSDGMT
jgi:hypothetical protein